MEINIVEFVAGARQAAGLTVLIDVFRATTTQAVLLSRAEGPVHVFANFASYQKAAAAFTAPLIFSELDFPAAHLDNSPGQAARTELTARELVSITTNGTRGLAAVPEGTDVVCGAFVNAAAVLAYIRRRQPPVLTLVAIGLHWEAGTESAPEDLALARYLRAQLVGERTDMAAIAREVRGATLDRFARQLGRKPYILNDIDQALTLDAHPVVPWLRRADGGLQLVRAPG